MEGLEGGKVGVAKEAVFALPGESRGLPAEGLPGVRALVEGAGGNDLDVGRGEDWEETREETFGAVFYPTVLAVRD